MIEVNCTFIFKNKTNILVLYFDIGTWCINADHDNKILTSIVILSSQLPFTHRSNESIPINQSGDGIMRDINDT